MIILVGRSASGKTYLGKLLEKAGFKKIVTYTSREKRLNEVDKIDYNFISKTEFISKIQEGFFFEYVIYNDNYYGTSKQSVKDLNTYIILEVEGLSKYKRLENVVSFYITCPKDILIKRMINRHDQENEILKRIAKDDIIFKDAALLCDYTIDSTKDDEILVKEIKEKYYGCLKLAK